MDKNTVTGLILMGVVIVLFTWLGRPSKEEIALRQQYADSVAAVQSAEAARIAAESQHTPRAGDILSQISSDPTLSATERDSLLQQAQREQYGELSPAAQGVDQTYTLSNDSVSYTISAHGAALTSVVLKQYQSYRGEQIQLLRPEDSQMSYTFATRSNRVISTASLYFEGEQLSPNSLRLTATADNGGKLSFTYTMRHKYLLDLTIQMDDAFRSIMRSGTPYFDAAYQLPIYQNEKSAKTEQRYSGITYQLSDNSIEKLNTGRNDDDKPTGHLRWIAFRDMFFSTIVYAPSGMESADVSHLIDRDSHQSGKLKEMTARFTLEPEEGRPVQLTLYTGPNDYSLLDSIDRELGADTRFSHVVDMGSWFRFINVWLIIPLFQFLERFFSNYGIIILLLTLFIKLLLSPFTFKSFISQAKMRVLRPQVEEINAKYPGDDKMMERQRATMDLYSKAGVSTMGGCLPMLLQMPFLIAMYQYFPTSINLRGERFLWAQDLSTYDDVIRFGFDLPFIGNHISLFCLLMTVTQVIYMQISQATAGQAQMPMMKWMPYIMAIFLFSFLNQNAAGLSYYYLLSMLISIIQTQVFRWSINEEKLLKQLEENKKKPKKKSKLMQRLEEMQKQQIELQKQQQAQAKRK